MCAVKFPMKSVLNARKNITINKIKTNENTFHKQRGRF